MAITYDDSTVASHPGQTRISSGKFFNYYGVTGFQRLYYSVVFKMSFKTLQRLMRNNRIVYEWTAKSEQFKFGCLNPSVIIDVEKGIIATYTNLTNNGSEPTSVIKISIEKLHLIEGKDLSIGQKIPSVAIYHRKPDSLAINAWDDFDPRVPYCFSEDVHNCDKLLKRLNDNHWRCITIGLEQIDDKKKPGLYYVKIDPEIANAAY